MNIPILKPIFRFMFICLFGMYFQALLLGCSSRMRFFDMHAEYGDKNDKKYFGLTYLITKYTDVNQKLKITKKQKHFIGGFTTYKFGLNPNTGIFLSSDEKLYKDQMRLIHKYMTNINTNTNNQIPLSKYDNSELTSYIWKEILNTYFSALDDTVVNKMHENTIGYVKVYIKMVIVDLMNLPTQVVALFIPHIIINYIKQQISKKLYDLVADDSYGNLYLLKIIIQAFLFAGVNGTLHLTNVCIKKIDDDGSEQYWKNIISSDSDAKKFIMECGRFDPPVTSCAIKGKDGSVETLCITTALIDQFKKDFKPNNWNNFESSILWNGENENHPRMCKGRDLSIDITTKIIRQYILTKQKT